MKVDDYLKASGRQETAAVTFADLRSLFGETQAPATPEGGAPAAPAAPAPER